MPWSFTSFLGKIKELARSGADARALGGARTATGLRTTSSPGGATHRRSIDSLTENEFQVVFNAMFVEECSKFIFEAEFSMMRLLGANVPFNLIEV